VHLKRQPSLVIEERDSELSSLIDRLLDRLGHTATRLRERASSQKLRRAEHEPALKPVSDDE
jgi:ribosome-associated translation inhibitor RaiA